MVIIDPFSKIYSSSPNSKQPNVYVHIGTIFARLVVQIDFETPACEVIFFSSLMSHQGSLCLFVKHYFFCRELESTQAL